MSGVRYVLGRTIEVGDELKLLSGFRRIVGFRPYDPPTGGEGRLAVLADKIEVVIFDDYPVVANVQPEGVDRAQDRL